MNANELAEKLLDCLSSEDRLEIRSASAQMLRKQQAEIEALEAGKIRAYNNGVEDGRKPNTHPVSQYKAITNTKIEPTVVSYTHPAELTDEEINVVAILQDAEIVPVGHEICKTGEEFNKYKKIVFATAKALRKASDK